MKIKIIHLFARLYLIIDRSPSWWRSKYLLGDPDYKRLWWRFYLELHKAER